MHLTDENKLFYGSFSTNTIHRCFLKCKSDEIMWILDVEKEQFFSKHQDIRYYESIFKHRDNNVNNCISNLKHIKFADPEDLPKLLIQAIKIEVRRQIRLTQYAQKNFKNRAKDLQKRFPEKIHQVQFDFLKEI